MTLYALCKAYISSLQECVTAQFHSCKWDICSGVTSNWQMSIRTHCCHSDSFSPWKSPSTNQTPLHLIPKWDRVVSRCHLQGVTGFSFTHFDMPRIALRLNGMCFTSSYVCLYPLFNTLSNKFHTSGHVHCYFPISRIALICPGWYKLVSTISFFVCHVFICCHSDWYEEWICICSWEHKVGCLGKKKKK